MANIITYFTVQFPLKTEKYQEDILDKRFEIGRQIYNSLVNITQKRYKEMIKTKNIETLYLNYLGIRRKTSQFGNKLMTSGNNSVYQNIHFITM